MRVCVNKSTGKLIEGQSGDYPEKLQTLIDNALAAGFSLSDLEVKIISNQEFDQLVRGDV